MKKKKKNQFQWPFSKWRQDWIASADKLVAEAVELAQHGAASTDRYSKAARRYSKAARFFRQAGLGLAASAAWQDAADCYAMLGDEERVRDCEAKSDLIPVYYSEHEA